MTLVRCQKQRCPTVDIRFVNVGSRCAREFHNLWMKCQEHKCYTIDIKKYMSTRIAQDVTHNLRMLGLSMSALAPQSNYAISLRKGIAQFPHVLDERLKEKYSNVIVNVRSRCMSLTRCQKQKYPTVDIRFVDVGSCSVRHCAIPACP